MKYLEIMRAKLAELVAERNAAIVEMETVTAAAETESRSALTPEEDARFGAAKAKVDDVDGKISEARARIAELEEIEARTAEVAKIKSITFAGPVSSPDEVIENRSATPQQLADAVTRSLEHRVEAPENMAHVRSLVLKHRSDREWARGLLLRSTEAYESAWAKVVTGRHYDLTAEERTALSTVTSANGDYLVPTHLDPTVILSNSGTSNVIRAMSRVVTVTRPGDTSWQGISSAGVTASFDAQLAEVSDDSPTFAQPTVAIHKAQAFVQASIEAADDIPGLATELLMMFADAKDRLEESKYAQGSGTNEPWGIFTALDANTNVEIVSDTAAAINKEDLDELYRTLPVRWRKNAKWLMHPIWSLAIQNLGTALSNKYSTNITEGPSDTLYRKPLVESDDAPSASTTTVKDNEIVFGDFSQYVIVDKPGSFAVEYIPHLFNTSNNLPDGRRGWYAHWRNGADSVVDTAFLLLQDKTSA